MHSSSIAAFSAECDGSQEEIFAVPVSALIVGANKSTAVVDDLTLAPDQNWFETTMACAAVHSPSEGNSCAAAHPPAEGNSKMIRSPAGPRELGARGFGKGRGAGGVATPEQPEGKPGFGRGRGGLASGKCFRNANRKANRKADTGFDSAVMEVASIVRDASAPLRRDARLVNLIRRVFAAYIQPDDDDDGHEQHLANVTSTANSVPHKKPRRKERGHPGNVVNRRKKEATRKLQCPGTQGMSRHINSKHPVDGRSKGKGESGNATSNMTRQQAQKGHQSKQIAEPHGANDKDQKGNSMTQRLVWGECDDRGSNDQPSSTASVPVLGMGTFLNMASWWCLDEACAASMECFTSQDTLYSHRKRHHHWCGLCDRNFASAAHLSLHAEKHKHCSPGATNSEANSIVESLQNVSGADKPDTLPTSTPSKLLKTSKHGTVRL